MNLTILTILFLSCLKDSPWDPRTGLRESQEESQSHEEQEKTEDSGQEEE